MNSDLISALSQKVKSSLTVDIVSFGELRQLVRSDVEEELVDKTVETVLDELLKSDVEIGQAFNVDGKYVKFVAWRGDGGDRVKRALIEVSNSAASDREFAFWLCLKKNVDEYE